MFQNEKTDLNGNSNKIKVLQLIRNHKKITRADIHKITGLSAPTVTRIIESLSEMNLIQTSGMGNSIGGRKPQLISFNSKNNYVIGIDIGGTYIRSALSNLAGEFIFEIHIPTKIEEGFEAVMKQVGELIKKLTQRAFQKNLELWGIGIAICGMVNKNTGIVEYSPIFGWRNVNVQKALAKYTNLNIAVGNVVQLFALAELLYGVGKDYSDFVCVNFGYGIGAGIIIDSSLFSGADGIAGEIGHIIVDKNSNKKGLEDISGTLEAVASGYGIADIAQEKSRQREDSSLHKLKPHEIDAKSVFDAAKNNDILATEILDSVVSYFCIGIDTLIKLFNTKCIVLSGGLINNGEYIIEKIRSELKHYSMNVITPAIPIVSSSFGENAALMGSFSLILEKILQLDQGSVEYSEMA
jgi:glucokinase-like ROK family protein